ncbi:hypothetical protein ACH5RR_023767 [Cinchona calisaya]|uniref:Uncharacterized protein n=1 Tax=Cinchona calisaya TaxID=153742 RepID=A0ABD2ZEX8_9GENT
MVTNLGTKVDKFSRDSSSEKFVKDVNHEGVEILSHKLANHLKTLQGLNSQLQDSREQLQEFENRKIALLKEETRIQAKMLQVKDRHSALTSGIADLEKSLDQGKKYEQLTKTEIHEAG